MTNDPFADPTPRSSDFASAASFRGRLILVEPTKIEHNVPKQSSNPNGDKGDKITANVTVVDGQGPIQIYDRFTPTGRYLDGPTHYGVWFNQGQIVDALQSLDKKTLHKMVLMRVDTLKPGTQPGQGNPWVVSPATDAEKATARNFLASQMVGGASAPTPQVQPAPAANGNPFAN